MERWFEAHGFPYIKMKDGTYYWQTFVATGEITSDNRILWHNKEFFDEIKKSA